MTAWTEHPTPLDVLDAALEHGAHYYALGYEHGHADALREAVEDAHRAALAARVARAGVEALDVTNARRRADAAPGEGPARRWAS